VVILARVSVFFASEVVSHAACAVRVLTFDPLMPFRSVFVAAVIVVGSLLAVSNEPKGKPKAVRMPFLKLQGVMRL
jgi:hypothetical protein